MNLRQATADDLLGMQHANLMNLPIPRPDLATALLRCQGREGSDRRLHPWQDGGRADGRCPAWTRHVYQCPAYAVPTGDYDSPTSSWSNPLLHSRLLPTATLCFVPVLLRHAVFNRSASHVVMLDNMQGADLVEGARTLKREMQEAAISGKLARPTLLESSGGIDIGNVAQGGHIDNAIDIISTSSIHQSTQHVDFSLKIDQ
ncbi:unnamed protein product [Tilletia controversa]|nr:unnamed protein product [Tilletia controversa]